MELNAKKRMEKCLAAFAHDLSAIRTGRAQPDFLSGVTVEYYGDKVPLSQVCSIGVQDSSTLVLNVWEKDMVREISGALAAFEMGLNPAVLGTVIKVPIPPLSGERRLELVKIARRHSEMARVSMRNVRRDLVQEIREELKEKTVSKDEARVREAEIQKLTNEFVSKADALLKNKEKTLTEI